MPDAAFRDRFGDSGRYAEFRPSYPAALFDWLASLTDRRGLAWDCATGTGQAAVGLRRHFRLVVATDASRAQIRSADRMPGIHYAVSIAERPALAGGVIDLIAVAQALHWFAIDRFFSEARRVLRPGGILAVWCYQLPSVSPAIDRRLQEFYTDVVGSYWSPERRLVDGGYGDVAFPIDLRPAPALSITRDLTLAELSGYLGTWSATVAYQAARGTDPVPDVIAGIAPEWGGGAREVRWPLVVHAGPVT